MPCNHCGGRDYDARQSAARTSGIFCAWRGHALLLSADRPRSTGADEYDGRSIPARTAPGTSFPMTTPIPDPHVYLRTVDLNERTSLSVLAGHVRSEEHTSELQSPCNLVCRLLL